MAAYKAKLEILEKCPFCGGEAELYDGTNAIYGSRGIFVRCTACNATTDLVYATNKNDDTYVLRKKVIIKWNIRPKKAI